MELSRIYLKTTIASVITSVVMVAATVGYILHMNPAVSVNAVKQVETGEISSVNVETEKKDETIKLVKANSDSEYIWVPMPNDVTAADVAIENHYMDKQLWIAIASDEEDFYLKNYISGNLNSITGGQSVYVDDKIIIKLDISHIYEYSTIFEDGVLYIEKHSPSEVFDNIVVLDPAGFVPDELILKDSMTPAAMCLDIAAKAKGLLEEKDIKVYVTNLDERVLGDEERLFLLEEVHPDMYIRIETSSDEDTKIYGTEAVYNGTYFIPGFGSVELADLLEKAVTISIGGRVDGLKEATENDIVISKATVPAASIRVGYYTNTQENILLNRDDYRSKIASGIRDAVIEGFGGEN